MLDTIFTLQRLSKAIELNELQQELGIGAFNNIEYLIYKNYNNKLTSGSVSTNYVINSNFYNNHEYLKVQKYSVANGINGTRFFHFQERESLALYTSLGLYIQELIKPTFENISNDIHFKQNVSTYYGADINIDKISNSKVTYKDDYSDYLKQLQNYTKEIYDHSGNFHIVKMDIKNFYYSIDHKKLLSVIREYTPEESVAKLKFSEQLESEILDYLFLLMNEPRGLPVSNQNVTSSYIANVFMHKLDDYIYKTLEKTGKEWKYLRYVDDIYILLESNPFDGDDLNPLLADISFYVANELGLQMNGKKSSITHINDTQKLKNFLQSASIVSNNEGSITLQFDQLLNNNDIIEKSTEIVKSVILQNKNTINSEEAALLNKLFLKQVKDLLENVNTYQSVLDSMQPIDVFNNRNILVAPKQILNFFNKNETFLNDLCDFISNSLRSNPEDHSVFHFVEYLLINESLPKSIIDVILEIKSGSTYLKLLRRSLMGQFHTIHNDNFEPPAHLFSHIPSLPIQCKYLAIAERAEDYSRCLNHLYNILIEFAKVKYKISNDKNYSISLLIDNMGQEKLSIKDIKMLKDIAHLRCNNGISHPGHKSTSKDIYKQFKFFVNNFLNGTH